MVISRRRVSVNDPEKAVGEVLRALTSRDIDDVNVKEMMFAMGTNIKCVMMYLSIVSIGTASSATSVPADCYREAIVEGSPRIIFLHNHPSGDLEASLADLDMCEKLRSAGEILGIEALDCIVFNTDGEWRSLISGVRGKLEETYVKMRRF